MTLILSGTNGVSDIDGDASTPAIRGTDANTGIFFGSDIIGFSEGGTECARFNADAQFVAAAGTASLPVITTTGDLNTGIYFPAADNIALTTGGTARLNADGSGRVTMPGQIGCFAGIAATTDETVNANSLVPFNTVTATGGFNTGTHFNTGTYLFTAPVAGRYIVSYLLYMTSSGGNTQTMSPGIRINGSFQSFTSGDAYGIYVGTPGSAGNTWSASATVILSLAANDTIGVAARGTNLRIYQGHSNFAVYLLG